MSTHSALIVKLLPAFALGCLSATPAAADTFGSGANTFTIDFVPIGNAGNGRDFGAGGGIYSSPYGAVGYRYRMGVTEVPQDWITKATNLGLANVTAGAWTGNQPAANMTWFEAAAFVNFLNMSTGHQAAYQLDATNGALTLWSPGQAWDNDPSVGVDLNLYRHKDAYYFLPSENEWYKAAFHKNDGVTANYWDYATGGNTIPTAVGSGTAAGTAVYGVVVVAPAAVNNDGGLSAYGTRGQDGNVWEWEESAFDGINDSSSDDRGFRGGYWVDTEAILRSSTRGVNGPSFSFNGVGFRVASVPEPSPAMLMLSVGLVGWFGKRRATHR